LTTDDVKDKFIVPMTQATQLSLCAQMKHYSGDARVQRATWFVSHAWRYKFLDLVAALQAFFASIGGVVVIWLDLFSTSQHHVLEAAGVAADVRVGHLPNGADGYGDDAVGQPRVSHARLVLGRAVRVPQQRQPLRRRAAAAAAGAGDD
jgi:hypothetical protein